MPMTRDPLTTLTELLHSDGWDVQLAGTTSPNPTTTRSSRGVAYVVPVVPGPTSGDPE